MSYEDDGLVSSVLRKIEDGNETVFDIAEKDGVKRIEVVRRRVLPEVRQSPLPLDRAPARAHQFHSIDAFSEYCERECSPVSSVILADSVKQEIVAVLDDSLVYGRDYVRFKPTSHPLFKPWFDILNNEMEVLEFARFCAKYRRTIVKPDGREVALIFQQLKVAKTIEIHKGIGSKSLNGLLITTEISGVKQSEPFALPETIEIESPIYIDGEPANVPIDILVDSSGGDVTVFATCPELEVLRSVAFESFVERLRSNTDSLLVGLGAINTEPWKTIAQ